MIAKFKKSSFNPFKNVSLYQKSQLTDYFSIDCIYCNVYYSCYWLNTLLEVPGNEALYSTSSQIFFLQFLKSLLLYHNIIPISLTVTLEFVKFFQFQIH